MGRLGGRYEFSAASRPYCGPISAADVQDRVADPIAVFENAAVPKPQNPQARAFELGGPARVVCNLVGMLSAVEFHDEGGFPAEEVEDEGPEWNLATPSPPAEPAISDRIPEASLGVGVVRAQCAGPELQNDATVAADEWHRT